MNKDIIILGEDKTIQRSIYRINYNKCYYKYGNFSRIDIYKSLF